MQFSKERLRNRKYKKEVTRHEGKSVNVYNMSKWNSRGKKIKNRLRQYLKT